MLKYSANIVYHLEENFTVEVFYPELNTKSTEHGYAFTGIKEQDQNTIKDCIRYELNRFMDERNGCVHSANTEEELINEVGNYYVSEFYRVSDECKAVYTTDEYSMILVDTHCDGNRSMCIFDNSKRRQELANRD